MTHSFDSEVAEKYGILEAVLLNNIYYWIEKNRANEQNFYDGTYWTYNSTRAFNELFPYVSERQIKNALKHLREEEVIITGNYNENAYDRTLWYALSEKGLSIVQKRPMEETKASNGKGDNVRPIPNNKPNIKPDINQKDTFCSEPENLASEPESFMQEEQMIFNIDTPKPVITFPLNDKSEYSVTESEVVEWQELYPALDVMQELRSMKGWLISNPQKRKTRRGINNFINTWLSKSQNKARWTPAAGPNSQQKSKWEDML